MFTLFTVYLEDRADMTLSGKQTIKFSVYRCLFCLPHFLPGGVSGKQGKQGKRKVN